MPHSAVAYLPEVFYRLAPELLELGLPEERRATCASCRMFPQANDPVGRRSFAPGVACCTYYPRLPNFLVGRQLRSGGPGAEALLARIAAGAGVGPRGVVPPPGWRETYAEGGRRNAFGQADFVRCPYLSEEMTCTVWADRGAVCRTWFCAHDAGPAGAALWRELKWLLHEIEGRLAVWAEATGAPPAADEADPAKWVAWYVDCADRVDAADAAELTDDEIEQRRDDLLAAWGELDIDVPEILAPALSGWHVGEHAVVYGYSAYDTARVAAPALWAFLSRLDGTTPWREAARDAGFPEADALELFRIGALEAPTDDHFAAKEGITLRLKGPDGEWVTLDPE